MTGRDQSRSKITLTTTMATIITIDAGSLISVVKTNESSAISGRDQSGDEHAQTSASFLVDTQVAEA